MQKVDSKDGLPIVTDEVHIVSAYVVIGCIVIAGILLTIAWLLV